MNLIPITKDTPKEELRRMFFECAAQIASEENAGRHIGLSAESNLAFNTMEEINAELARRVAAARRVREQADPGTKDDRASEDHTCA